MATSILDLPNKLLVNILAGVASESSYDLFQSKLCCKEFLIDAEDEYVFKNIILDQIMSLRYHCDGMGLEAQLKAKAFLDVCEDARNLQTIYHKGMEMFIGYDEDIIVDKAKGAKLITNALLLGYKEA